MNIPLRFQIVLWSTALTLALMLASSAFLHYRLTAYLEADFARYVEYEVTEFREALAGAGAVADFAVFAEKEVGTHPSDLPVRVELLAEDGSAVFRSSNLADSPILPAVLPSGDARQTMDVALPLPTDHNRTSTVFRVITMPVEGSLHTIAGRPLWLRLAVDLSPVDQVLSAHRQSILYAVVILLVFAIPGGWLVAAKALRPIHTMIRQAERISASNLSEERLPVRRVADELDDLAVVMNRLLLRLDQSVRVVQRFTSDAAHELRTPLTSLRGELELMALHPEQFTPEGVESLLEEIDRLSALCSRLLLLAEMDERGGQLERRPVRLDLLLERIVEQFTPLAESRQIQLTLATDGPAVVPGNESLLTQVYLNLLDNAVRHTPPGGAVKVDSAHRHGTIEITVADTGPGIPTEHRARIFERFYRVKDADGRTAERGGAGLGLAIVAEVLSHHGGSAEVGDVQPHGAAFRTRLPAAEGARN